jgi:D-alanyl-lipoteichoic acid acyltransferase DltB (MBOAT superfamily)
MLFNSAEFALFLPIVFLLYWLLSKNLRSQNILLLLASYFFYACWDYRFLFLLVFSTLLDYVTGLKMAETKSNYLKKIWFWSSITINLGFLAFFKYFNFFIDSFSHLLGTVGLQSHTVTLNIILPIGISFYTFHGLSYVIDIFHGKIKPEKNFVDYSLFVSYFPLLVAGPIERAMHLLPQIQARRQFNYARAVDGMRQILWGLFKKIVIADNCAGYVDTIFSNSGAYSGSTLLLGAILFSFQIYCDFSGYSDIALGVSRLFGIELLKNFAFPYFSRDIAEFWRRWHISLTTWFRDYVYIPLGGSRGSMAKKIRNTFIIFLISGFWHGANWTFVIWGLLNALFFVPLLIFNFNRKNTDNIAQGRYWPSIREFAQMTITFLITTFGWIFFRAETVSKAVSYIKGIFTDSIFKKPEIFPVDLIALILLFLVIEWLHREKQHGLQLTEIKLPKLVRWSFYYLLLILMIWFGGAKQDFIYFQF